MFITGCTRTHIDHCYQRLSSCVGLKLGGGVMSDVCVIILPLYNVAEPNISPTESGVLVCQGPENVRGGLTAVAVSCMQPSIRCP